MTENSIISNFFKHAKIQCLLIIKKYKNFSSLIIFVQQLIHNIRSPLNVLEWHVLWKFMNKYFKKFGNVTPCPEHSSSMQRLTIWNTIVTFPQDTSTLSLLSIPMCSVATTIDDLETSAPIMNVHLGNFTRTYRTECIPCIDLAWFDREVGLLDRSNVVTVLASYLTSTLKNFPKSKPTHHGSNDFALPVPLGDQDLSLWNFITFVYREAIRQDARRLVCPMANRWYCHRSI